MGYTTWNRRCHRHVHWMVKYERQQNGNYLVPNDMVQQSSPYRKSIISQDDYPEPIIANVMLNFIVMHIVK